MTLPDLILMNKDSILSVAKQWQSHCLRLFPLVLYRPLIGKN